MRTTALPWRTSTCGFPRASSDTVTCGLLAGGCGGSRNLRGDGSGIVPEAQQHPAAHDLDAAAGLRRVRHHDDGRLAALGEAVGDRERASRLFHGSPSAPSQAATQKGSVT